MKVSVSFLVAGALIAFVLFAILYWVFKVELNIALTSGISGALAGVMVDLFKERRKRKLKDIEA